MHNAGIHMTIYFHIILFNKKKHQKLFKIIKIVMIQQEFRMKMKCVLFKNFILKKIKREKLHFV